MNDVIQRIKEACLHFTMRTGNKPTVLYLGTAEKRRLDDLLKEHVRYSAPIDPQIYEQTPIFHGMKLLTVLGEPDHLAVA